MRVSLAAVIAISSLGSLVGQEAPAKGQPVQQPRAEAPRRAPQSPGPEGQRPQRAVVRIANPEIDKALLLDLAVRKAEARVQWGLQVGSDLGVKGERQLKEVNQVRLVGPGLAVKRPLFLNVPAGGGSVVVHTRVAGPLAHGEYAEALRELESVEDAFRSAQDRKDILRDEVDRATNLLLRLRGALWQDDGRAAKDRAPNAEALPAARVILLQGAGGGVPQTILPPAVREAAERFSSCLARLWAAESRAPALTALDEAGKELMALHRALAPVAPPPSDRQQPHR